MSVWIVPGLIALTRIAGASSMASCLVSPWMPAHGDHCGEPVFVPRRTDAAEGDGFVLCVIFRGDTQCSDLAVFDAQHLADGPLALAHLSHRVPAGFHGNWRDAA